MDELTPADLWREVPDSEDEFWQDIREKQLRLLKAVLEGALEEEMIVLLGAGRHRRTQARRGHRNGFYERDLGRQIGIVTVIRVPRARGLPPIEHSVFRSYRRRQTVVHGLIRDIFLAGVSTRRVGESLEALLGESVSAQTVSRVARSLDRVLCAYGITVTGQRRLLDFRLAPAESVPSTGRRSPTSSGSVACRARR